MRNNSLYSINNPVVLRGSSLLKHTGVLNQEWFCCPVHNTVYWGTAQIDIVITFNSAVKRVIELSFLLVILLFTFDGASLIHTGNVFIMESELQLVSGVVLVAFAFYLTVKFIRRYHYVLSYSGIRSEQWMHLNEIPWDSVQTLDRQSFGESSNGFIMKLMDDKQTVRIILSPLITEDYRAVMKMIFQHLPDEKITESTRRSKEWIRYRTIKHSST